MEWILNLISDLRAARAAELRYLRGIDIIYQAPGEIPRQKNFVSHPTGQNKSPCSFSAGC